MQNSTPVQSTHATTLWINGVSHSVTMLWVTQSHAEIIVGEDVDLVSHQLTAVIVREFLSLPMRVVAKTGQNVVLHFVQKPHRSVLNLIDQDLVAAGIKRLRETMEDRAVPDQVNADVYAWQDEAEQEDARIVETFASRVRDLENHRAIEPRRLIAA